MTSLAIRAGRRILWATGRALRRLRGRPATRRIRRGPAAARPPTPGTEPSVLVSYRVGNADRLRMLRAVVRQLDRQLAGLETVVRVLDASPTDWSRHTAAAWAETSLRVRFEAAELPLTAGYASLLARTDTRHCYLQLDDQLTAGLTPGWLAAAGTLLDRYDPDLDVVTPLPALSLREDGSGTVLAIATRRLPGGYYRLGFGGVRRPLVVEDVGGFTFGIFENFSYGFFFNHLVARTADYLERLDWYQRQLGTDGAHTIELAAAGAPWGPVWTHIAVPLDGVCMVDLDYAHTEAAVREENPGARRLLERLEGGWELRAARG